MHRRSRQRKSAEQAPVKKKSTRSTSATTRRKSSGRRGSTKKATRSARPKAAKRGKKQRLYTRYDPETGQKVRVPNTAMEYFDWPSRKPTKKKIARAALKADPVGVGAQLASTAAKKAVERSVERASSRVLRAATPVAVGVGGSVLRSAGAAAAALPPLGVVGALAAAGILGGWLMDKATDSVGDKINRISLAFVAAQQELMKRTGVTKWGDVPVAPRTKLLNEYKAALNHVAKNPGLARFEKTPTF